MTPAIQSAPAPSRPRLARLVRLCFLPCVVLILGSYLIFHGLVAGQQAEPKAKDQRVEEIKEFIGRYFKTWSNQDMKGYDGCFLPDAAIQFIDEEGQLSTYARRPFVANQADFHRKSLVRATEVAESIDVRFEAKLARVVVYWKLTAGLRTETGYDHFTLIKHEGNWRIVNLTFYPSAKKIAD